MNNISKLTAQAQEAKKKQAAMKVRYTPKQIEKMQSKMALSEKGLFAAFGAVKWPWLDEKIMEQPCYASPFAIKAEVTMSSEVTGTKNPPTIAGASKIISGIFTFIRYNPFFWWKDLRREEWVWSGTRGTGRGVLTGIAKFFFCITLKGFGSPILLLFYALKFFVIFMYALKIPEFFTAVAGTLVNLIMMLTRSDFRIRMTKYTCTYDGDLTEPDCSQPPEAKVVAPFVDMALFYLGMILPLHMILGKGWGKTYGQGGLSALIIVFALISAALIIVTGCNIVVIFCVVLYFIFKSAVGFANVTTGKDIRNGGKK